MWPDSPWLVDAADEATTLEDADVEVAAPGRGDFSERLLRRFLRLCENPRTRGRMLGLVRASVDHTGGVRFYAMLNKTVLSPVARISGVRTSSLCWEIVASQLVGIAMMRYVLEVEPIASADVDTVVAQMAPALRAVLKG